MLDLADRESRATRLKSCPGLFPDRRAHETEDSNDKFDTGRPADDQPHHPTDQTPVDKMVAAKKHVPIVKKRTFDAIFQIYRFSSLPTTSPMHLQLPRETNTASPQYTRWKPSDSRFNEAWDMSLEKWRI